MRLIRLNIIDSTNDYLLRLSTNEELVALAEGLFDETLSFSLLLHPRLLSSENTDLLSMAHRLAVYDALSTRLDRLSLKRPNEILCANRKIGTTRVESKTNSSLLTDFVFGTTLSLTPSLSPERMGILYEIANGTRKYVSIAEQELRMLGECPTVINNYRALS